MKTTLALLSALLVLSPGLLRAIQISYAYDAAGRMTAVNYDGASRTAYGYDKNGNLLSRVSTVTPVLTPPPHLASTYNGLITNGSPDAANTGVITLKLLANGSYSGKLTVGTVTISFSGSFAADGGSSVIPITGKPPLTSLDITLGVLGSVPRITGTLTGSGFSSDIAMEPAHYNTKTHLLPAGLIGKYTVLLMPTETMPDIPQSDGYAILTVKKNGSISMAGRLPDNSPFTQSSLIHAGDVWPLFVPLYKKSGFLSGKVVFATATTLGDFTGSISWLKPVTSGPLHPAGFSTTLNLTGASYLPPAKGQRALLLADAVPNLVFTASGGGLVMDPLVRNITLDGKNKFIITPDASALKLNLMSGTGLFSGTFKDGSITRAFSGVVLQPFSSGSGYFLGSVKSGLVELGPIP